MVANPTVAGTEADLTALQVGSTKYKVPSGGGGTPYDSNPAMDGTASPGSSTAYARGDHVHPTQIIPKTKAQYAQLTPEQKALDVSYYITDDDEESLVFDNAPTAGSSNPVTSNGIRAAIDQVNSSPLVAATASAMTDTSKVYVYTGSEVDYTNGHWYYYNGSTWADGGVYNAVAVNTDTTLTLSGVPADAKVTGDELNSLESALSDVNERIDNLDPGLSDEAKAALLACFRHVAFLDDDADYYGTLENALYATGYPKLIVSFLPGDRVFYTDEDVSVLADYLTVRYYQDAEHSAETIAYGYYSISGSLSQSVNTVSISYAGITSNITVNAIVLRSVALTDIASHVGYSDISISDGTVTPSSVQTFSVLTYNVPFVRFSFAEGQNRLRYVYRKTGDNYYVTDGINFYLFTKNGSKYDATNVTETEQENSEIVGNPYASSRQTAELDANNGILKVSNDNGYIQFNNANALGYWGANNAAGIASKFTNVMTINS